MSQSQRAIPQSKEALLKSYTLRLKDDVKSMLDNFTEIIKLARVSKIFVNTIFDKLMLIARTGIFKVTY